LFEINSKLSMHDNKLAIVFKGLGNARKIIGVVKRDYGGKGSWKNYIPFYYLFFDHYLKEFMVDGKKFVIEPDGHTYMDGLAFWTDQDNEVLFYKIVETLKEKVNLTVEKE